MPHSSKETVRNAILGVTEGMDGTAITSLIEQSLILASVPGGCGNGCEVSLADPPACSATYPRHMESSCTSLISTADDAQGRGGPPVLNILLRYGSPAPTSQPPLTQSRNHSFILVRIGTTAYAPAKSRAALARVARGAIVKADHPRLG
jgi:hypothetical protein